MTATPGPQSNPPPAPATDAGAADAPVVLRRVRSFVVRGGRMTVAQERAWQTLWPRYGRELDANTIDLDLWFGRHARRVVEIGFGNGESLLALAAMHPDQDFLGIEVHRPGVGHLLLKCAELGLTNVRVLCHDAMECLAAPLPACSFAEVLLYFPDPWPKKRHHKRRIVQPAFASLVADRLKPGGTFHLATDWEPYALHMLDVLNAEPRLVNAAADGRWTGEPATRAPTRFERRGRRLGHDVFDLEYRRA